MNGRLDLNLDSKSRFARFILGKGSATTLHLLSRVRVIVPGQGPT